jgi:hypothetical protein
MQTVTPAFLNALRGPHKMLVTVERSTSAAGPWTALKYSVSAGSVSIDRGDVRRTLTLTIVGWTSNQAALADISPYYTFIRVKRGVQLPTGPELVPLGIFRVYDVKAVFNSMEITAYSQEVDVRDRRLVQPWVRAAVTTGTISAEMTLLLNDAVPGATFSFGAGTSNPNMGDISIERDRLKGMQDLAQAAGGEFHTTALGAFTVSVPAKITGTPVWTINAGKDGVLVSYTRSYSRGRVYNAVIVSNETSSSDPADVPIRVLVADMVVGSPTYWNGPFGKVPRFYTSNFITTRTQAINAGQSILSKDRGLNAGLDFEAVPNPALDVNDVVKVVFNDGTSENHVIDTIKIGLGSDSTISATTRVSTTEAG